MSCCVKTKSGSAANCCDLSNTLDEGNTTSPTVVGTARALIVSDTDLLQFSSALSIARAQFALDAADDLVVTYSATGPTVATETYDIEAADVVATWQNMALVIGGTLLAAPSRADADASADDVVIADATTVNGAGLDRGLTIFTSSGNTGTLAFADPGAALQSFIRHNHTTDVMELSANAGADNSISIMGATGSVIIGGNTEPFTGFTMNVNGGVATFGASIMLSDVLTDATIKTGHLLSQQFTNALGSWMVMRVASSGGDNFISIGGSHASSDSATYIDFYTSAAPGTAAGTIRGIIDRTGFWHIGPGVPAVGDGNAALNIVSALQPTIQMANVLTDATDKSGQIVLKPYTNANTQTLLLSGGITVATAEVNIGGGHATYNAVESVIFWTAANTTTLTGTQRGVIDGAGLLTWNAGMTFDSADPTVLIGDGTGSPTVILDKVAAGTSDIEFQDAGVTRWQLRLDAIENMVWRRHNGAGAFQDVPLMLADATGSTVLGNDTEPFLGYQLNVMGGTTTFGAAINLTDIATDAAIKTGHLVNIQYNNADGPWMIMRAASASGANFLSIGGSHPSADAATYIDFNTAATSGTAMGTIRGIINNVGHWTIGTAAGTQVHTINGGLDITLDSRARQCIADGDNAGVAATNSLTNGAPAADDTTAVLGNYHVNGSAGVFTGWIKMYVGATAAYVPYWVDA